MKKMLKGGLACLFLSLLLLGWMTVHTTLQLQADGKLINYVGIVRGATQRLIKLELQGEPGGDLTAYLDGILAELNGGEGVYGLPAPRDEAYQENLGKLTGMWDEVKAGIAACRADAAQRGALLELSEAYFDQANDTVFAAEAYSANQVRRLLIIDGGMLGIMLLTWLFIFWAISKKTLILENTNKELNELARRDALTGALKLDAFKADAQALLDVDEPVKYAIVYTDFADFKYINDVFGYAYGDSILKRYGQILGEGLRAGELCGRVSADNFVLLLRYRERAEVAERQRRADRAITEFMHDSREHQSLPSYCGICCVEDVMEDLQIDGLMDRANFARKTVKNGTNHNYVYYDDRIRERLWAEKEVENKMLDALERREFKVYYQPI